MPCKHLFERAVVRSSWDVGEPLAVDRIIRSAIFELIFKAAADLDAIFRSYGNIAAVEEAMEIAPKEQAVVYSVGAAFVIRLNVGGLESGQ